MMLSQKYIVVLSLVASVVAFPSPIPYANSTGSPCAEVSASAAAALAVSPSGKILKVFFGEYKLLTCVATPIVDPALAYDCLTSVPLHQEEALELVDSILPYVQWQTGMISRA